MHKNWDSEFIEVNKYFEVYRQQITFLPVLTIEVQATFQLDFR
jgi:hypothetical protein